MIDWGGGGCGDAFSTSLAFDPTKSKNNWHKLPSSPLAPSQIPSGVWTGRELPVLVSGIDPDGKPISASLARFAAYNPRTDAWHRLRPPPEPASALASFGMETSCWSSAVRAQLERESPRQSRPLASLTASPPTAGGGFPPCPRAARLCGGETGKMMFGAETRPQAVRLRLHRGGLAFDPAAQPLVGVSAGPRSGGVSLTAVWTGRSMILWGGGPTLPRHRIFTNRGLAEEAPFAYKDVERGRRGRRARRAGGTRRAAVAARRRQGLSQDWSGWR